MATHAQRRDETEALLNHKLKLISPALLVLSLAACGGAGTPASPGSPAPTPSPVPLPAPVPAPAPAPAPTIVSKVDAARFLNQATFGARPEDLAALTGQADFSRWLNAQKNAAVTLQLPYLQQLKANGEEVFQNQRQDIWWRNAVTAPDQLRQRMAFALSEIMVVSDQAANLDNDVLGLGYFYDLLARNALGNFRTLLEDVTLSTQMGRYLSMINNQKPDPVKGIRADENFARELMQLFTVGKTRLNPDGTAVKDGSGNPVASYTQADIENLARVFTGWGWRNTDGSNRRSYDAGDELFPMQAFESFHDIDAKTLIDGVQVPAGQTAAQDLKLALDTLFNHPNTAPFISRQLIQRLVTSNPSPAYVQRVATVFANNGNNVRGDLFAVAVAILTDSEARQPDLTGRGYGKLREPLIKLAHAWRVFDAVGRNNRYDYWNGDQDFLQAALRSPSVFNFFQPQFQPVGAIAAAGLAAPEFQIVQENSVVSGGNKLWNISQEFQFSGGLGGTFYNQRTILLDFRPWESKASNANLDALIEEWNGLFLAGQMPDAMRTTLREYLLSVDAAQPQRRLADGLMLMLSSPQYAVQR